jgi:methylisocitrate lyase
MTEFGKSELVPAATLQCIGYNAVIYPVSALRLAMFAAEAGLREIFEHGTQAGLLDRMQHRSRLYELLRYEAYNEFDSDIFNFTTGRNP